MRYYSVLIVLDSLVFQPDPDPGHAACIRRCNLYFAEQQWCVGLFLVALFVRRSELE